MKNKLPNLLIAGVAKSGTSSLHKYLAQHPEIFMSKAKEPRFISSQAIKEPLGGPKDERVENWYIKDFDSYKALFSPAINEKIIGESSADTSYFYTKTIPVIKKYFGDPKIIIVIRNPVNRAYSAFQHLLRDEREHLSFEEALLEEEERIKANYELIYHYKSVSTYHDSLKAFMDNFSNVKVIVSEELSKNPNKVLKDVFEFLEVSPDLEVDTSIRYNLSGIPRSRWLHELLFEGKAFMKYIRPGIRLFLGKKIRAKISRKLMEKNLQRTSIKDDTKEDLMQYFMSDIKLTENLLGKDLSDWYKCKNSHTVKN